MTDPIDPIRRIGPTAGAPESSRKKEKKVNSPRIIQEPARGYDLRSIDFKEAQQFLALSLMHDSQVERWNAHFGEKNTGLRQLQGVLQKVQENKASDTDRTLLSQAQAIVSGYESVIYTPGCHSTTDDLQEQIKEFHALGLKLKPAIPPRWIG